MYNLSFLLDILILAMHTSILENICDFNVQKKQQNKTIYN